jgi:hypothetical protein
VRRGFRNSYPESDYRTHQPLPIAPVCAGVQVGAQCGPRTGEIAAFQTGVNSHGPVFIFRTYEEIGHKQMPDVVGMTKSNNNCDQTLGVYWLWPEKQTGNAGWTMRSPQFSSGGIK